MSLASVVRKQNAEWILSTLHFSLQDRIAGVGHRVYVGNAE